jgi:uridine kinase
MQTDAGDQIEALSQIMKSARARMKCKQKDLAEMLSISTSYYNLLENGKKLNPDDDLLCRISATMDVDFEILLHACGRETRDTHVNPTVIGIGGASCAGKSWLTGKFQAARANSLLVLDLDGFYRDLDTVNALPYKHDNPKAVDLDAACDAVVSLKAGKTAKIPIHDFETHGCRGQRVVAPAPIIIVEGLFIFSHEALRKELDVKIWIESAGDLRLKRRLLRDTVERGRDVREVLQRWDDDVVPAFNQFLQPLRDQADVIWNNDATSGTGTPLITDLILAFIARHPLSKNMRK